MRPRTLLLPLLALLVGAGSAQAQRRTRFELTDEDVEPLRIAIPARAALVRWLLGNGRNYRREMDAVVPFAYVPPGARYDGQCSHRRLRRDASGGEIVFTMPSGKTDAQAAQQMYGEKAAAEAKNSGDLAQAMHVLGRIMNAGEAELGARTKPLFAWYRSQGFRRDDGASDGSWLTRGAGDGFRIIVDVSATNDHTREPYCQHLNGPMLTVMRTGDDDGAWEREVALRRRLSTLPVDADAPVTRSDAEEQYAAALGEAGLTDDAFEDLLTLIFALRRHLAAGPDSETRRAGMSELQRERLDANVAWMRRHGGTILPLVDALRDAYDTMPAKERRAP